MSRGEQTILIGFDQDSVGALFCDATLEAM